MYAVVQQAAGLAEDDEKDELAVARGRLGGIARAKALTPERRTEVAKRARAARTAREAVTERREQV